MICQRCAKEKAGIHTCTPSDLVRGLEQQNAELVAALQMLADLHDASGMPQSAIRMNAAKAIAKVKQP